MGLARAIDLISLPLRVGAAVGVAWLAVKTPMVAAVMLGIALVCASVGAVAWLVMRRAVRARGRIPCVKCGHGVLEAAKLCPKCHTPRPA